MYNSNILNTQYNLSAKRPSLAPSPTSEENVINKPTKTLRKKKIVQLTPQQVSQLSPRSPRIEDQEGICLFN